MAGRNISSRAQADHYRQLALWTSDERTHHILMEMARELEAQEEIPPRGEAELQPVPRSLS